MKPHFSSRWTQIIRIRGVFFFSFIAFLFLFYLIYTNEPTAQIIQGFQLKFPINKPNWKTLNLYNLSQTDLELFFAFKEQQYQERRNRIAEYCSTFNETSANYNATHDLVKNNFIYDQVDKVGYCQIAKVGSSTWCYHFIKLSNATEKQIKSYSQALQAFAPKLWPLPDNSSSEDLKELTKDFVTIVINRHPFSRLASVYYQKFINLGKTSWQNFAESIIKMYRKPSNITKTITDNDYLGDNPEYASPQEYISFIINNVKKNLKRPSKIDPHWRPQYTSCPYCAFNFTIYSKLEEIHEDSAYFFIKSNLTSRLSVDLKKNSSGGNKKEFEFWKRVDSNLYKKLESLYYYDLEFFNYNIEDYFDNLGIVIENLSDY